jgi:hypothetical protein
VEWLRRVGRTSRYVRALQMADKAAATASGPLAMTQQSSPSRARAAIAPASAARFVVGFTVNSACMTAVRCQELPCHSGHTEDTSGTKTTGKGRKELHQTFAIWYQSCITERAGSLEGNVEQLPHQPASDDVFKHGNACVHGRYNEQTCLHGLSKQGCARHPCIRGNL